MKLIGIESVDYVNKNGKRVSGVRLHVSSPAPAPGLGDVTSSYYVTGKAVSDFQLGDIITLLYEPGFNGKLHCTGCLMADPLKK